MGISVHNAVNPKKALINVQIADGNQAAERLQNSVRSAAKHFNINRQKELQQKTAIALFYVCSLTHIRI